MTQCKTYQVVQHNAWCCPGMLIFVQNGMVIGHQTNPENTLTLSWFEEDQETDFDPSNYQSCILIS